MPEDFLDTREGEPGAGPADRGTPGDGQPRPAQAPNGAAPEAPRGGTPEGDGAGEPSMTLEEATRLAQSERQRRSDMQRDYDRLRAFEKEASEKLALLNKLDGAFDLGYLDTEADRLLRGLPAAAPAEAGQGGEGSDLDWLLGERAEEAPSPRQAPRTRPSAGEDPVAAHLRNLRQAALRQYEGDPVAADEIVAREVQRIERLGHRIPPSYSRYSGQGQQAPLTAQDVLDLMERRDQALRMWNGSKATVISALGGPEFAQASITFPKPPPGAPENVRRYWNQFSDMTMTREQAIDLVARATGETNPEICLMKVDPKGYREAMKGQLRASLAREFSPGAGPGAMMPPGIVAEGQGAQPASPGTQASNAAVRAIGADTRPPKRDG